MGYVFYCEVFHGGKLGVGGIHFGILGADEYVFGRLGDCNKRKQVGNAKCES